MPLTGLPGLVTVAIILAVVLLIVVAGKMGYDRLQIGTWFTAQRTQHKTDGELEAERTERREARNAMRDQAAVAFQRYAEAAVAMVPIVEAAGQPGKALELWLDVAASSLGAALSRSPGDHYRVAIWADYGDRTCFRLAGSANHRKNDPGNQELAKAGTIGGYAFGSKDGEYLCADRRRDRRYKGGRRVNKPYLSIFAIRLGAGSEPWGVMTIDAPTIGSEAFRSEDLVIVRRFAQLVSAGTAMALASLRKGTSAAVATEVPKARIVAPSEQLTDGRGPR